MAAALLVAYTHCPEGISTTRSAPARMLHLCIYFLNTYAFITRSNLPQHGTSNLLQFTPLFPFIPSIRLLLAVSSMPQVLLQNVHHTGITLCRGNAHFTRANWPLLERQTQDHLLIGARAYSID